MPKPATFDVIGMEKQPKLEPSHRRKGQDAGPVLTFLCPQKLRGFLLRADLPGPVVVHEILLGSGLLHGLFGYRFFERHLEEGWAVAAVGIEAVAIDHAVATIARVTAAPAATPVGLTIQLHAAVATGPIANVTAPRTIVAILSAALLTVRELRGVDALAAIAAGDAMPAPAGWRVERIYASDHGHAYAALARLPSLRRHGTGLAVGFTQLGDDPVRTILHALHFENLPGRSGRE